MSLSHKGIAGEELIASIVVVILVVVFVLATINVNTRFASDRAFNDARRTASTMAEKLYFESSGLVTNPAMFVAADAAYPVRIVLTDTGRNLTWEHGGTGTAKSVASASAAILIVDGQHTYPARLEVFVPA